MAGSECARNACALNQNNRAYTAAWANLSAEISWIGGKSFPGVVLSKVITISQSKAGTNDFSVRPIV